MPRRKSLRAHRAPTTKRHLHLRVCCRQFVKRPAGLSARARVSLGRMARKHDGNPFELAAAGVLPGRVTLVIMEACALSSRQRAVSTTCAVLPLPGIVG